MKQKNLPPVVSKYEMDARAITQCDFVFISGDAYIDHPSFGAAIISRLLISRGYTVGVIAQPDWHSAEAFRALGRPRLGFLVSAGNIDSMVNHYSVALKHRDVDAYSPNGEMGRRPDRACIVYGNRCREAYAGVPVILGGIEASLRRFAHYDYWDDRVRHSILYDATADLLVYGMGERAILDIADALNTGTPIKEMTDIAGTCVRVPDANGMTKAVMLPSYTEVSGDKRTYAEAFLTEMREQDAIRGKRLLQPHEKGMLLCNPPAAPLSTEELDAVYALPYTREPIPIQQGHIPAIDEVSFSITSARGCFGNCNFCALTFHQGRIVQARSHASILSEAQALTKRRDFKGYIHDVGGPTANFRRPACKKQLTRGVCADRQCLGYHACKNLEASESDYTALLQELRKLPNIKKVFVRSGVRYDYLLMDREDDFLYELIEHHISGQLKVAPEHVSDRVLEMMNKPAHSLYERFVQKFEAANKKLNLRQYLVPYLMSSHPGSQLSDAIELAQYLKKTGHRPEQVQDFYPTPGTVSTCMYYTELDPRTMESVYVPKTQEEKAMQRALMQCHVYRNHPLIRKALRKADRDDLIGNGKNCLVPEEIMIENKHYGSRLIENGRKSAESGRKPKNTVDKRRRSR
ncbi:MAG: YgiQ family radical SAM protein [Clostridia bacterium]